MTFKLLIILPAASFIFLSCTKEKNNGSLNEFEKKMDKISEQYIKLVLNAGKYDPDFVDAYYGPKELKPAEKKPAEDDSTGLKNLYDDSGKLLDMLDSISHYQADEIDLLRYKYLYKQLLAVRTKLFMIRGGKLSFDEESKALYDAVAPEHDGAYFQKILDELDKELPGSGDIQTRLNNFKKSYIIPKARLDTIFQTAIAECKKRTLNYIDLPRSENFKVEYVTGKPWGGYNWYKGNFFSLIQVNTDLPIYIDRAVDIAAHEGYPGHHVYNTMLEKSLVKKRGWLEFTVYPLFSPQSFIAEGTANYGIKMAFPGDTRIKFEKEVLFPLAGLDSSKAGKYYKILEMTSKLSYAGNEAARNYIDGKWTKEEVINWLMKYSLMSPEHAEKHFQFIEKYRSYVINYNLGEDLVKDYIEKNGGAEDNPDQRWNLFERLISLPQIASNLK
ncbi:MAG TPA: hypothetical protein VMT35_14225 [Ignavibacteriaceae bacterium]|nr:hypothetical protein [Ignavibacteriaceae bacterium]